MFFTQLIGKQVFAARGLLLLVAGTVVLAVGCNRGGTKPTVPALGQGKQAIGVLNDAARVMETIKDKATLEAARPELQAIGVRLKTQTPLLATTIFLSKEAPGMPREMAEQMAAHVQKDPKFQPYLADANLLLADPEFRPAYRRYNQAMAKVQQVPEANAIVLESLQIKFGE